MVSYEEQVLGLPVMEGPITHYMTCIMDINWTLKNRGRMPKRIPTPKTVRAIMSKYPSIFEYKKETRTWKKVA